MSWNIQKPGDYINGPLTVVGAATFSSDLSLNGSENYINLFSNYSVGSNARVRFRAVGAGGGSGYGGDFRVSTRASNNAWNTDVLTIDSSGRFIRGGATADTLSTDGATMVNIGNFAVQNAASTGTLIAIKPDVANQNVNINVDARSGGIPDLRFLFGSVEKFRMTATGNINFQSGQGINFGATSEAAGMTSEILNDYEEGTWTGTLKGSVSDPTTPVTVSGRYTKIGRSVTIDIYFSNVNTAGASGPVFIAGLPFSVADRPNGTVSIFSFDMNGGSSLYADFLSTFIYINASRTNGSWVDVLHSAGTNRYLRVTGTYTV